MFEESLVESKCLAASSNQRWTALASITLQCSLVAVALVIPLLHPERLGEILNVREVLAPLPPPQRLPRQVQAHMATASSASAGSSNAPPALLAPHGVPTLISRGPDPGEAPVVRFGSSWGNGPPMGTGSGAGEGEMARVNVMPATPARPVRVSAGVSQGLLIAPIRPIYPQIARAAHLEGVVVVEAIISKAGTLESAHVVSGPAMLRQAALDAVSAARYSPFQLNGESTEVETTITIMFRLGS
jgi:protein TonB